MPSCSLYRFVVDVRKAQLLGIFMRQWAMVGVHNSPSMSSLRTQGPTTTGTHSIEDWLHFLIVGARSIGPCVRRDDAEYVDLAMGFPVRRPPDKPPACPTKSPRT